MAPRKKPIADAGISTPAVSEEVVGVTIKGWSMPVAAIEEEVVTVADAPAEPRILILTKGAWQVRVQPSNGHVYLETIEPFDSDATQVYIGHLDQPTETLTETDITVLSKAVFQTFLKVVNG